MEIKKKYNEGKPKFPPKSKIQNRGILDWTLKLNRSLSSTNLMSTKQKHLFLKSPNLKFNPVVHSHSLPRRLRIADILLADQDHDGVDCMDAFRETSTKKCFSPLRLVESLLAPLRPAKGFRLQQRRQNETGELNTAPAPTNELKGSDDSIENPGNLLLIS